MVDRSHKAPTAVSLAPLAEKSPFERFVGRYWPVIAGVVVLVVGGVIVRERLAQKRSDERNTSWDRLSASTTNDGFPRVPVAKVEVLERVADERPDAPAAPWALLMAARQGIDDADAAGADRALRRLESGFPQHSVVVDTWPIGPDGSAASLAAYLSDAAKLESEWRSANAALFANPALPADARSAEFRTAVGGFSVGLYSDRFPDVTSDFMAKCSEGGFNGTNIYVASPGQYCEFGDPSTRSADRAGWGIEGNRHSIAATDSGLRHFAGVVSIRKAAEPGTFETDRYRVSLIAAHELDGDYLVIGAVTQGLDVLKTIAARESDPARPGELKEPVSVEACEPAAVR
jgi:cyclophilin family peptidyl-prolyl cis-trans isomerase